ncbi:hypothetical protein OOK36_03450 [Streptomyces sp. NBC_00365]|uniref:hypothetical protein n=1 Tax=Streptomyces sp. NBC_00365 TaxID=2975726 RepID=UPI00224D1BB4|nr:hypothetical protein [Streptomyces sp. NBC_00365]MCX5087960.1 hypothetical protein [Streptomyces sp. NBC_00365]
MTGLQPGSPRQGLATQGDAWDTQWDMFRALIGATVSVLPLGRPHDQVPSALAERQGDHCVASR